MRATQVVVREAAHAKDAASVSNESAVAEQIPPYTDKLGLCTNGIPGEAAPKRPSWHSTVVSGLLAFVGILSVSALHHETEITAIIGSFGASAVLLYDAIGSPLAQPRNVVGGHCVGALVGVTVYKAFGETQPLLACAVAVAFAIMLMDITVTLHPPAGATALIAVLGPAPIHDLGYMYVLSPVMLGATIMTCVAVLGNNLVGQRRYPSAAGDCND